MGAPGARGGPPYVTPILRAGGWARCAASRQAPGNQPAPRQPWAVDAAGLICSELAQRGGDTSDLMFPNFGVYLFIDYNYIISASSSGQAGRRVDN
jgi:hypothetical protein